MCPSQRAAINQRCLCPLTLILIICTFILLPGFQSQSSIEKPPRTNRLTQHFFRSYDLGKSCSIIRTSAIKMTIGTSNSCHLSNIYSSIACHISPDGGYAESWVGALHQVSIGQSIAHRSLNASTVRIVISDPFRIRGNAVSHHFPINMCTSALSAG